MKGPFRYLWTAAIVFLIAASAYAQVDQGRIGGLVTDQSGAVIPGVTITILNERTAEERNTLTGDAGTFTVAALRPSTYTVKATLPGFAPAESKGIVLIVGQRMNLDLTLRPANLATTVNVETFTQETIDTSSAAIGANVDVREVQELPLNGRQLSQLYLQAPGSVNSGSGTFGDIRFSGRAVQQNVVRYDGVEGTAIIDASPGNLNGEVPSPFRLQSSLENVQEFRVDSNNFPAEFGTGTGGQISVVTKSGSNDFHGSLFEYLRNDALDARNFFDIEKAPLRLNQFGGSIGGPIIKGKLFFFGSYEGYRVRSGVNFVESVPSDVARARAVPAVAPLIDAFRDPKAVTIVGASTNLDYDVVQLVGRNVVNENSFAARVDYKINDKHSLYTRFFRDQAFNDAPEGVSGRHAVVRATPQNGVISFQSLLSASTINEFKVGFNEALTRINGKAPVVNGIDLSAITINTSGGVASTGIAGQGSTTGLSVPGGLVRQNSATNGRGAPYTPWSISLIDNFSWMRGHHNMKFGGEVRMIRMYTDRLGGTTYSYTNLDAFLANTASTVQYLGDLSEPSVFNNGATGERFVKQEYYIGYAQDEWKLAPKLTLNYGLRYEYYTPLREDRDLQVVFNIKTGVIEPNTTVPYKMLKTNFAPRVALSYAPSSKTVFRGGFGIYYGPGQTEDQIQPIESDRISSSLSNLSNAFPVDANALRLNFINNPTNRQYQPRAYAADEYRVPERIYQYSLSMQQELPGQIVVTAAYAGSQGRNLFLRSVANQIVSVTTNSNPANAAVIVREFDIVQGATILRPFAEVDYKTSGGHDNYNALQLSVVKRSSIGLTFNSQYTLARSKGNTAGSNEAQTSGDPRNFEYDDGYNNFDVRHTFNVSTLYDLPFGRNRKYLSNLSGIGQVLLGDWELGTIVNARSGVPIDMRVTRPDVVYVDGSGNVFGSPAAGRTAVINTPGGGNSRGVRRPDLIPGVDPFLHDQDRAFLNPAAFATPAPGTYGNLERNSLKGPAFGQFDLIFNKRFSLTEATKLEFRTEIFNVFNHTNFRNPPSTLPNVLGTGTNQLQPGQPFTAAAAGTFGIVNSTVEKVVGLGTNRQIQFALKLTF